MKKEIKTNIMNTVRNVTLKFKKKDFNHPYTSSRKCAITRALKRAGIEGCKDVGIQIEDEYENEVSESKSYDHMTKRVSAMYMHKEGGSFGEDVIPEEPKDFQVTILLEV